VSTNPVTVLVVDDEIPIRQELRAFPWDSCGAALIGEAENGEEALAMCERQLPDIIVSDITMPIMDGLALMQEVRRRYPAVQVILLTCHSEFQFAKEAIRLGATEYILKVSLEEEELRRALGKAKEALDRERGHRREELKLTRAKAAKRLEALLHEYRLRREGAGRAEAPEIGREDWELLGFEDRFPYRFVRLWASVPAGADYIVQDAVRTALLDFEQRNESCAGWFPVGSDETLVWFTSSCEFDDRLRAATDRLFGQIRAAVAATSLVDERELLLRAVIGAPVRSRADALEAVHATAEWKEAAFYADDPSPSLRDGMPPPAQEFTDEHRRWLLAALRQAGWDAGKLIRIVRDEVGGWCAAQRVRPGPLKQWLTRWISEWLSEQGTELPEAGAAALTDAPDLQSLIDEFVRIVASADAKEERARPEVREAKAWIKDHLQDPLTLSLVAERVGLRPEYFSRLFKDETGESVNQYITRLRMEKALDLLKHSPMKVYEVAEAVGIPNYRYFTYTFRNWAGAAPTDIKRNHRPADRA